MTIWEKAAVNMQKGGKKIVAAAATLSEQIKIQLAVMRLRIRIDEVQTRIDELHRAIGMKVTDLTKQDLLPKTTELLLKDDVIVSAITELADRAQEIEELKADIRNMHIDFKDATKHAEDSLS